MNKGLAIITFFLFFCTQDLPERHYKSIDEATGGFNKFLLDLFSNGKLELTVETSIVIEQNEAGTIWEKKQKKITGKWSLLNETIRYSLDRPKSSIDSVFLNTDFDYLLNNPIIRFSSKLDTAYIYGIPCVMFDEK